MVRAARARLDRLRHPPDRAERASSRTSTSFSRPSSRRSASRSWRTVDRRAAGPPLLGLVRRASRAALRLESGEVPEVRWREAASRSSADGTIPTAAASAKRRRCPRRTRSNETRPGAGRRTSRSPSVRRAARRRAPRCRGARTASGSRPPHRPDPVELLEEQAQTRVPELVPIRYGRMLVSPFTFYRGAAYLMASDLAGGPRTGLHAQLCGDAHLSNFGVFAAPDRRLVFGINDFDETLPGPVRVGPQAAGRELRGRRPRPRLRRRSTRPTINLAVVRSLPRGDARASPRCGPWTSGTPGSTSRSSMAAIAPQVSAKAAQAVREEPRQGADEGQPRGVRQADRDRRRRAADRQRPAADRPDRRARRRRGRDVLEAHAAS